MEYSTQTIKLITYNTVRPKQRQVLWQIKKDLTKIREKYVIVDLVPNYIQSYSRKGNRCLIYMTELSNAVGEELNN